MRLLPLDYPVRNLGRKPGRTLLTGTACALVAAVLVATVAFVRGLERSFASQGRADVTILLSTAAQRDLVRSAVGAAVGELVAADVGAVLRVHGRPAVSAEIHMGTKVRLGRGRATDGRDPVFAGFVRGVTEGAFLVHENVTLVEGRLPRTGEVLVGDLVAAKLGVPEERVRIGETVRFEGGSFVVAGRFSAPGTTIGSEIWTPLHELKGLAQRDDVSAVFVRCKDPAGLEEVDLFAQRRLDLELEAIGSLVYYGELAAYFAPIRFLAWAMAVLIALTVVFTGANTLNTAVQDRLRELATLRALGYGGAALVTALLAEALLLTAAGGLAGLLLARLVVAGSAFRIGMSAFALDVGGLAVIAGFAGALLLGLLGTIPAGARVLRMPVALALKGE